MVQWGRLFSDQPSRGRHQYLQETHRLLPRTRDQIVTPALPAKEVTKVALRLKYQVEQVISCELDESLVTKANSTVITKEVIQTAREAGGEEYRACVVFCLLVCVRWFKIQALVELWDSDLHELRAVACEILAKRLYVLCRNRIEAEEDQDYLMLEVLLKRYSILRDGEPTSPANVIERAVDLHALVVIGSAGYQKCIKYLWQGWLCQDDQDPTNFIEYRERNNPSYWSHFNPDRLRAPVYQNAVQVFFSILYLVLFTVVINTVNPTGDLDVVECILYGMTLGFILDEATKFWKVGRFYFGFWNAFNSTLYSLLLVSFILRIVALTHSKNVDNEERNYYNQLSYNFLAFSSPMFWGRLLLYLDTYRFFGAMLVVLKVMMKESLIFFALLAVVIIGFMQGFIGMDQADPENKMTAVVLLQGMANTVLQNPSFDEFQGFAPPFGILLYYLFTFVVMVDITGNAINEYMGLFAHRTLQYVRAPDENVFIAPLNLVEIICLIIPFEWWLPSDRYDKLNNYVMGIIYSPLLLVTALLESTNAQRIRLNRRLGEDDDDTQEEWENAAESAEFDFKKVGDHPETEAWDMAVTKSKPNVEVDQCVLEIRGLKEQVRQLTQLVTVLTERQGVSAGAANGEGQTNQETNGNA
ncbi:vacuolar cation channel [Microsporum canis CBS 113480]|uniref:Vacuolar cation channel n=1 Tax=Arthroderma otae (strain ATCC MYA-4605 / CBS 113480) TaxID=554155 RepID=C5FBQ0_ARTOC|nr:vacuolar cation channel [Microsporum canis CBS 113480]EEQ27234.1 vacuolar cation channel [Microsporum canis CBS 113480]